MSQLQVNQVKDKAKTKKKKRNDQTTIKNQQNYSNPYQATSILLQVSNERVEICSWERQVPRSTNVAYKIKITIPERIGKIYTMADRETD
jgi:hypothetical protein